jgi:hypothetical protein
MFRGLLSPLVAALMVLAVFPAASSAGQLVFATKPSGANPVLWVVNEDGSGARGIWVPTSVTLRAAGVRNISVAPASDAVTFDSGVGLGATYSPALYRWQAGDLLRISPPSVFSRSLESGEGDGDATADGRIVYEWDVQTYMYSCLGYLCDWWPQDRMVGLRARPRDGGDAVDVQAACDEAADPAANPAQPQEIAYVGCDGTDSNGYTGPILAATIGGQHRVVSFDDARQHDPSWSPDGQRIVVAESGGEPGLWVYGAGGSGPYLHVLATGTGLTSPRFVGNDRIAFVADGDIWTIPAGTEGNTFPASATRLTSRGDVTSLAWTSAPAVRPLPASPDAGAESPAPTTGQSTTPLPAPPAPPVPKLAVKVTKRASVAALRRGLSVRVTVPGAGVISARATVSRKVAKKLHVKVRKGASTAVVMRGATRATKAGTSRVTLKLVRAARRPATQLRRQRLRLTVTFTPRSGPKLISTANVSVR